EPRRLGDQGLLPGPGCGQGRHGGRHQEGLPQARPGQPPGLQAGRRGRRGALQVDLRGLCGAVRPHPAQGVRRAAKSVRRRLRLGRVPPAPARAAKLRLLRHLQRWRGCRRQRVLRPLRRHLRRRRLDANAHQAAPARSGRRDRGHLDVRAGFGGAHGVAGAAQRRRLPGLLGHRSQGGDDAEGVLQLRRLRDGDRQPGRRLCDDTDLPAVPWAWPGRRRPMPGLP
ncbi:MAG: Chaperone protein DnaJ, partial [uncultured Nocardioidaceae bacterium]